MTQAAETPSEPRDLTVAGLYELPDEAARSAMPVRVRGVLTYYEPGHRMAFLQDATGAIYLHVTGRAEVAPGDEVEVSGFLDPGYNGRNIRGANFETSPSLRRIGPAAFPLPVPLPDPTRVADAQGACWMSLEGHVSEVRIEGDRARLSLRENPLLPVYLPGLSRSNLLPGHVLGMKVRLHGILADSPVSASPLVMRRQMLVPGIEHIVVSADEKAARFEVRMDDIGGLRWISEREGLDARVQIRGKVTWLKPGEGFFLQNGANAAWVHCTEPDLPVLGQAVICAGRPTSYHGVGVMRDSMWLPDPEPIIAIDPLMLADENPEAMAVHGRLTRMNATLVEVLRGPEETLWILEDRGTMVFAHLHEATQGITSQAFERAAVLSFDGILLNQPSPVLDFKASEGAVHLFLRGSQDVRVLSPAPFWTLVKLLMLLATVIFAALLAAAWVLVLRRKVKQQSEIIRATASREAVDSERLRIAREWHDTFEQHFAGLTMLLDATATVMPEETKPREMLDRAARMADHSRSAARQVIWDLRAPGSCGSVPFAAQLEDSFNHAWPDEIDGCLNIECGERELVLPRQTTQDLLRIAHEAVTNAFKHSGCETVIVHWDRVGNHLVLSVSDDGCGLATESLTNASLHGHFGLLGMKERATKLEAALEIISPSSHAGKGTTIRIAIAQPNPDS
jgi:signal transduction histidine kinase